ncbi:MAG: HPr family phosphocarrier protein [Alphaproteobacteria bacterium]|nr:MAG: HPr family phosphocarrier protein [Alphaproteobacteria bacterium]
MLTKEFTITNKLGLHARPAAMFVKVSSAHDAEIWVEKDDEQVNGKSIMGLMMLAAGYGAKIKVSAEGKDANAALDQLEALIASGFSENR